MNVLGPEENKILIELCQKYQVNPDHLRILVQIKKEYSYKSGSKANDLRNEIEKHIQFWAKSTAGEKR